jgi:hypothetical protein
MGLVVARFRTDDPIGLLPALRDRTAALLGRSVRLSIEPSFVQITAHGMNVMVFDRGPKLEVRIGGRSWLSGAGPRVKRIREVFTSLGGVPSWGLGSVTYRFDGTPPDPDALAAALAGRVVQRYPVSAVLRSGLRTPVEIVTRDRGLDLEAPIVIFGKLYDSAVRAAGELCERVPLGSPTPPRDRL